MIPGGGTLQTIALTHAPGCSRDYSLISFACDPWRGEPATDNTGTHAAHALLFSCFLLMSKLIRLIHENRNRTALKRFGLYCLLRRKRDSNPRSSRPDNGFQDRRNRPLCHFSIVSCVPSACRAVAVATVCRVKSELRKYNVFCFSITEIEITFFRPCR